MDLIIKPTEACNFKCTFCSSTHISEDKGTLDLQHVFSFLKRFHTDTIIVNGGDPLMMKPEYYWELIEFIREHSPHTIVSLTTNLWAFYKKPSMWKALFLDPNVRVITSFNYGNTRLIDYNKVYTEDHFWKVSDLFLKEIGYRPDFISVITEENETTALDNVRLARAMNVECKLNYAVASGIQSSQYMLAKIYKKYLEVYHAGLMEWEFNTKQMITRLKTGNTVCPQLKKCDSGIRVLQPDGDYYSCGAFGDDMDKPIDFQKEVMEFGPIQTPLSDDYNLLSLKEECFTCPMFAICNGCKKTIKDMKQDGIEYIEEHCSIMKTLAPDIIALNNGQRTKYQKISLQMI